MTEKGILVAVTAFRNGVLAGRQPHGLCFMVCAPLATYLQRIGLDVELQQCEIKQGNDTHQHYYLLMDNKTVIDPTASQFNDPAGFAMPEVYIGELPAHYKVVIKNAA